MRTQARRLALPLAILGVLLLLHAAFLDGPRATGHVGVVALIMALLLYRTNGAPRVVLGMVIWVLVVLIFLAVRWFEHGPPFGP